MNKEKFLFFFDFLTADRHLPKSQKIWNKQLLLVHRAWVIIKAHGFVWFKIIWVLHPISIQCKHKIDNIWTMTGVIIIHQLNQDTALYQLVSPERRNFTWTWKLGWGSVNPKSLNKIHLPLLIDNRFSLYEFFKTPCSAILKYFIFIFSLTKVCSRMKNLTKRNKSNKNGRYLNFYIFFKGQP